MPAPVVLLIFVLSGAAGLIFEVVWSRQLVLVFGNTTQAISAILTGFFAGLAIGSWLGGKIADRVMRPLRMYGLLECGLVVAVLFTPLSFRLIHEVYHFAFDSLQNARHSLAAVRFTLTLLALAPATTLMGATLPTLTRYLARDANGLGFAFARLYLANTMGAVFGAAIAGLILIEAFGLSGALIVGAACSATAGVAALMFDFASRRQSSSSAASPPCSTYQAKTSAPRVALLFAFSSGFTSLAYQSLWTRLLSSGTGNSTYVFTLILAVFLTGLAMGAVEYKRSGHRVTNSIMLLAGGQILIAVLAVIGMYFVASLDSTVTLWSWRWKTFAVVLPPTFIMGVLFPAAATLVAAHDSDVGSRSGLLLAANTIGAIIGTFLVPFVAIPLVGSPAALALIAIVNAMTGVLLCVDAQAGTRRTRSAMTYAGVATMVVVTILMWTHTLFVDPNVVRLRRAGAFYRTEEDEIASVQAGSIHGSKQLWVNGNGMTALTVDTKLMPIITLALRPSSMTALVIAFGMGSAYRTALIAGLRTEGVDLVPSVPRMFDFFYADAPTFLNDPRGKVIIADGRNFVALTKQKYDIIIVDPPPPVQSAGVSIISSREFYQAARERLNPAGVMMQWVPLGQTVDEFKAHVRTFRDVFQHVIIARGPAGSGFYMLGSNQPLALDPTSLESVLSRPGVVGDLGSAHDSPENTRQGWFDLIPQLVVLSGIDVEKFAGRGPLITDDHPLPEYFLLRLMFGKDSPVLTAKSVRVAATP